MMAEADGLLLVLNTDKSNTRYCSLFKVYGSLLPYLSSLV